MEETTGQQSMDPFATTIPSADDRVVELHPLNEQAISPEDGRIVPANPSADASSSGASRTDPKDQPSATSEIPSALTSVYPFGAYNPQDQGFYYGGYENGSGNWDEHSSFVNTNNLHVLPPAMYNENPSLFFPPSYGFDAQMAYGQFSPLASPISPIMIDGQLYSPHQIPVSPPYFPPVSPGLPHSSSGLPVSQGELATPGSSGAENLGDNVLFGPGSGYYIPFGSFGGGDLSANSSIGFYNFQSDFGAGDQVAAHSNSLDASRFLPSLTSSALYPPQPIGILGSYEQNAAQGSFRGVGSSSSSSTRRYPHGSSYQGVNYASGSNSHRETSHWNRVTPEKGGRRDRDRDSVSISADSLGISSDRNRGPRASKPKNKSSMENPSSSGMHRDIVPTLGIDLDLFNRSEFVTDYERAKFFVIKSFSEDNVHKSIKYNVWASTPLGNRKLDAAFHEAKDAGGTCPIFLFFSVNASGQFCGVAEMVGSVDFENDADYWQQDRWSGQFPVKWHIIKDVPNSRFRHILLENNDNKPVTHSRDCQEVNLDHGVEMLKIFKDHEAETSLLDDFTFYDEREKALLERKSKQRANSASTTAVAPAADAINQLSDNLAETLHLDVSKLTTEEKNPFGSS